MLSFARVMHSNLLCNSRKDRTMNVATPFTNPRPAISEAERARRAYAVNFGAGSTRFEGGILSDEAEAINARFVAGELTEAEWIAAVLESNTARLG